MSANKCFSSSCSIKFLAQTQLYLSLHFAFSLTRTLSCTFLSKNRKDPQKSSCSSNVLSQRSSCAVIMQPQRSSCGFQDSTQVTRNQPQEELLIVDAKISSCTCIIFWAVLYSHQLYFTNSIPSMSQSIHTLHL